MSHLRRPWVFGVLALSALGAVPTHAQTDDWFNVVCQDVANVRAAEWEADNPPDPDNPSDRTGLIGSVRSDTMEHCGFNFPGLLTPTPSSGLYAWANEVLSPPTPESISRARTYVEMCSRPQVRTNALQGLMPDTVEAWFQSFEDVGVPRVADDAFIAFNDVVDRVCETAEEYLPRATGSNSPLTDAHLNDIWVQNPSLTGRTYGMDSYVISETIDLQGYMVAETINALLTGTVSTTSDIALALADFSRSLFAIIALLALLWGGYQLIFKGGDLTGFIKTLGTLGIVSAIFLFLLSESTEVHPSTGSMGTVGGVNCVTTGGQTTCTTTTVRIVMIVTGLADWVTGSYQTAVCDNLPGGNTAQTGAILCSANGYTAGTIVLVGMDRALHIWTAWRNHGNAVVRGINVFGWPIEAAKVFVAVIGTLVVAVIWMFVAFAYVLLWIEGYFVMVYGLFILGFSPWEVSRDKAIGYLWYCLGWAFRTGLFAVLFILTYLGFETATVQSPLIQGFRDGTSVSDAGGTGFFIYVIMEMITSAMAYLLISSIMNTIGGFLGSTSSMAQHIDGMVKSTATRGVSWAGAGAAAAAAKQVKMASGAATVASGAGMLKAGAGAMGARRQGSTASQVLTAAIKDGVAGTKSTFKAAYDAQDGGRLAKLRERMARHQAKEE